VQPVTIGRRNLLGAAAGAAAALLIAPAGAADERVIRKTGRGLLGGPPQCRN
jgi:gas vesicle protein